MMRPIKDGVEWLIDVSSTPLNKMPDCLGFKLKGNKVYAIVSDYHANYN